MDKQEYKLKAEEIKSLISKREFQKAVKIADQIDWNRVRSVAMLCTVSDLYKINRRYKESKELLLMAYERHPGGRMILYSLCELCTKLGETAEALEYCKKYVQLAPMDSGKYILQYKIYEAEDVSLEERIAVLEELKKRDYREKWGYELAYLYHRIGLATKCVEECDQLILWFSDGRYVKKAMELKMLHEPLSAVQQANYERLVKGKKVLPSSPAAEETKSQPEELDIQVQPMKLGEYDTINLQKNLAEYVNEVLSPEEASRAADILQLPTSEPVQESLGTVTGQIMAPMYDTAGSVQEVFFEDNTTEIAGELKPDMLPSPVKEQIEVKEIIRQEERRGPVAEVTKEIPSIKDIPSIKEIMSRPLVEPIEAAVSIPDEVPSRMAGYLSQEYDGQISLVVPEDIKVEKQITGQMNIEDVLVEWEKAKKENEEKRRAQLTEKVLAQTGSMFTNFEETIRDGILEQLEKENMPVEESRPRREIKEEEVLPKAASAIAEEVNDAETEDLPEVEELEEIEEQDPALSEGEDEEEESLSEETEKIDDHIHKERDMAEDGEAVKVEKASGEQEERDPESGQEEVQDNIQQDNIRELTEEEKALFGAYIQTKGGRRRFMQALDRISLAAYTGNVIVIGEGASGTINLAKNIMKDIQMTDANFSGVIAKVTGASLNSKNMEGTIAKLNNGGLIIEKASGMSSQAVTKLLKALNQEQTGIVVILEDNKKAVKRMLAAYPAMDTFFNARIEIEELNNGALAEYGRQYAYHMEYSIDELGMLALQTRIEDRQTSDHIVTVAEVRELVDEAIAHADRKNLKHFFDLILGKRYDNEDMIILREKDFM
ncbi:MAG: hypothetical protein IJP31_08065 [Lachnospiraceae bacterium]|nr:hypothetical protein [Lachnospiraceae bacterium]